MLHANLLQFLLTAKMEITAELTSKTEVKLLKKGNTLGPIYRIRTTVVTINSNYQDQVNAQRIVEGQLPTFKSSKPTWGENITSSIVTHNNNYYLQVLELATKEKSIYVNQFGTIVEKETFEQFLPKYKRSSNTQFLEEEVNVKRYNIENITKLVIKSPFNLIFN